uniref:Arm repeat protein-like n=1 Tax=Oryza sativa subsp. japonica TaxID=39947 RepID=Q69IP9_ORYSJ|nr:arm repeat protein-like [Oryza sativa Japonica Group]
MASYNESVSLRSKTHLTGLIALRGGPTWQHICILAPRILLSSRILPPSSPNLLLYPRWLLPRRRCDHDRVVRHGRRTLAVEYNVAQLSRGSTEEWRKVTSEARKLSKHNVFCWACLVDDKAVPWLLCFLSSTTAAIQDNAVASLLNLLKHPAGQMTIMEVGGVGLVVDVINVVAKAVAQHNVAAILFYLSSNNPDASRR